MTNNEHDININIFIDLDAIFDTRIVTLYFMAPDIAEDFMSGDKYYNRVRDNFGWITYDMFNSFYRNRTDIVLRNAMLTSILKIVSKVMADINLNEHTMMLTKRMYVNYYPYDISSEMVDELKTFIGNIYSGMHIDMVRMSNRELTPSWVKENVSTIIKYDAVDWLAYHTATSEIISTPLINVLLIGPAISNGVNTIKNIKNELFTEVVRSVEPFITYMPINTEYFNVATKKDKEQS